MVRQTGLRQANVIGLQCVHPSKGVIWLIEERKSLKHKGTYSKWMPNFEFGCFQSKEEVSAMYCTSEMGNWFRAAPYTFTRAGKPVNAAVKLNAAGKPVNAVDLLRRVQSSRRSKST